MIHLIVNSRISPETACSNRDVSKAAYTVGARDHERRTGKKKKKNKMRPTEPCISGHFIISCHGRAGEASPSRMDAGWMALSVTSS